MRNWQIPRRTFLRGAGVAMGLPWLDVMAPREAAAAPAPAGAGVKTRSGPPVRMAILYMPNGANMSAWTMPQGPLGRLSPILEPLTKVKSDLLVLSELWNQAADTGDGHYVKGAGWLTCTTITKSDSEVNSNGVSMDQFAAQKIGHLTPLPSLELSIEDVPTGIDPNVGYTRQYAGYISWSAPETPVARETNPKAAFDRLFRVGGPGAKPAAGPDDKSVLDAVLADARALKSRVGSADQKKLDEFLASVRQVETQIANRLKSAAGQQAALREARRAEIEELNRRVAGQGGRFRDADLTDRVRLMLDLLVLAFQTDSTRIASFMFGAEVTGRNFSFLPGVSGGFHDISHHGNDAEKLEQYKKINLWHVQQFAYLLEKMKGVKEGSKTLLDNAMVLFGSGMSDGNSHSPRNLPLVLAGRGGGTIVPGRAIQYPKGSPLSNLYVSMLNRLGITTPRFADSTKPELPNLAG